MASDVIFGIHAAVCKDIAASCPYIVSVGEELAVRPPFNKGQQKLKQQVGAFQQVTLLNTLPILDPESGIIMFNSEK